MSSAALHTATHQPTALPAISTHSPSASPPNRQYTPGQSPNREGRYANREYASASPRSTSKRPSGRSSGNSANATNPGRSLEQLQPTMASRTTLASLAPVVATATEYQKPSSSRRRHEAPVAPPRTSSTQHGNAVSGGSSSRRAVHPEDRPAGSSRRTPGENGGTSANGYGNTGPSAYDESSSHTKRTRSQQAAQETPHISEGSRDHRQTATTTTTTVPDRTRDQHSGSASSKQPSREASEVLNRVIVSQPEVDLEREKERQGEARPHAATTHQKHGQDDLDDAAASPVVHTHESQEESRRGGRSRHDHSKREKSSRFGDYYLGNTIGEGEFGKVKLGWKQDGGVQVAIKLIRRDTVGNNPSRLTKIYREISILQGLSHPNIVRLHEMTETERHIGIVLEYASGGELFDYILNHRYLKDHAARRLFAQLISGVGYLHKKGIVHRDLKLENLLLDRNRNIIITDFGFANTFDADDELTEEEELNLSDRDFIKRTGLDQIKPSGMRRGDLMQTSCGSPCYAAPELVVSDSLYTGRKVDVWSCGVILYAMLAGYLPFDDDPDNPEGDNINLLYKYIVNTPLTFPEYVTPHARDLLRRILVPSPRKRADLFEVARHSWLSEYAHVVELITSTTTTSSEIQNTTVPSDEVETEGLARSASVREPSKAKATTTVAVGDLARKQGKVDAEEATHGKQQRDTKRRTVQVEYVAPTTQTQRGAEQLEVHVSARGKSKAKSSSQGAAEAHSPSHDKPLPKDPPVAKESYTGTPRDARKPPSSHRRDAPPPRVSQGRSTADHPYMTPAAGPPVSRPATGGSMHSSGSRGLVPSSRASYGLPLPPAVAGTNAQGSIQQPKGSKNYVISNPIPQETLDPGFGRPSLHMPPKFAEVSGFNNQPQPPSGEAKGHRRSNTIGEIGGKLFGRSGSIFGTRKRRADQAEKPSRKYPPVSMSNTMPGESSRTSMDSRASRRSFSLGLGKKRSGSIAGSQMPAEKPPNPRRFSLLKAMGLSKDPSPPPDTSQSDLPIQDPPELDTYGQYIDQPQSRNPGQQYTDGMFEQPPEPQLGPPSTGHSRNPTHRRHPSESQSSAIPSHLQQGAMLNSESESSIEHAHRRPLNTAPYQPNYDLDQFDSHQPANRQGGHVLQKNKRFVDAYDEEEYGRPRDHAGSSGAAKRVMDFFRRRGRARGGEV